MVIQRGEIWWANLREPLGSEPGYRRPVLVVQADSFNRSRIQTVLVVVLTSNVALADAPGNVLITSEESGLPKDSVANVSQVVTIDQMFLSEQVGQLTAPIMETVSDGLRLVFSL